MLNKNGFLMYCNCSLEPEEGEKIIEEFLSNNKNAKIIKFKNEEYKYLNNSIKRQGWIRVLPNDKEKVKNTDGFFIAQLQKI
jgi:16S rRNA (cytosine967-C5)-methyltransferase